MHFSNQVIFDRELANVVQGMIYCNNIITYYWQKLVGEVVFAKVQRLEKEKEMKKN